MAPKINISIPKTAKDKDKECLTNTSKRAFVFAISFGINVGYSGIFFSTGKICSVLNTLQLVFFGNNLSQWFFNVRRIEMKELSKMVVFFIFTICLAAGCGDDLCELFPDVCEPVEPDSGVCTPDVNPCEGLECGEVDDGCDEGNIVQCGSCAGSAECVDNVCIPCESNCGDKICGEEIDSCGNAESCGTCETGNTCSDDQTYCEPDYEGRNAQKSEQTDIIILSRVTEKVNADGDEVISSARNEYDSHGNITAILDPNEHVSRFYYDEDALA
jgi:hypothetical protein